MQKDKTTVKRKVAKIVSDGTPTGTHIILDDGSTLKHVTRVSWDAVAGAPDCSVKLEVLAGDLEIEAAGNLTISTVGQDLQKYHTSKNNEER